ncbi:hypothetical protein A8H32_24685 [Burkholderia thailandensis]|nr:hypothetical protein AQ475_23190 [Burkholderia thailandensis]AVR28136.1 hypothetical protein A8H32_24685 [Burkholderia thailandensis]
MGNALPNESGRAGGRRRNGRPPVARTRCRAGALANSRAWRLRAPGKIDAHSLAARRRMNLACSLRSMPARAGRAYRAIAARAAA